MKKLEFKNTWNKINQERRQEVEAVLERDYDKFKVHRAKADKLSEDLMKTFGINLRETDMDVAINKFRRRVKEEYGSDIEEFMEDSIIDAYDDFDEDDIDDSFSQLAAGYTIRYYRDLK